MCVSIYISVIVAKILVELIIYVHTLFNKLKESRKNESDLTTNMSCAFK